MDDEKLYMGNKIREMRQKAKMSQEALGERLNPKLNGTSVGAWEKGRSSPKHNTLLQLCEIFKCNIDDFYEIPDSVMDEMINASYRNGMIMTGKVGDDEADLLMLFESVNDLGRAEIMKRVREISQLSQYKR